MRRELALCVMLAAAPAARSARAEGPAARDARAEGPAESAMLTLSLDEAVQRARAQNPTLAQAKAEIARAEGVLRAQRAPVLPTLTANGTYTRLDNDRLIATTPGQPPRVVAGANQVFANVALAVPLVNVAGWLLWGQSEDNVEVARVTADDARRTLAVATARAYLTVLAAHRVVEASEQAVTTAQGHADFATKRFRGGLGRSTDVVRAEQEVAVSDAQLEVARAQLARAQEALGVLVAVDGPVNVRGELPSPELPTMQRAEREALDKRQDVRAAAERSRTTARVARDSWAEHLPTLTGTFAPFYQDPPTIVNPQLGWQAQLVLTLPLYDGGARYGRREQREAAAEQARAGLEQVRRQALSDVRVSYVAMDRADGALRASQRSASLAKEALDLTTLSYEAGAATNLELIDAERRLRDAQIAVAVAENAARQARLDLLAACGRFP